MIIGITGTDGAGKGAVVDYLVKEKGYVHCSARAIWEEEFAKRGMTSNRANMRLVANELRATHGNDFLIKYYLPKIKKEGMARVVIESIRATAEVDTLKKNGGVLIAVDADQRMRYERIVSRGSTTDQISFEKFQEQEAIEMNDPDTNGMQKAKVLQMADHTILNEGTLEELGKKMERVLTQIVEEI